jgi:hypothetical protein
MGLLDKLLGGGKSNSETGNSSKYKTYKTKDGTTIKQGDEGKIFTRRSTTQSGGSKKTTYWYDKRKK